MNRIATIVLTLSILSTCRAYSQFYQSTNFKEGSGLPSSETYMVHQDTKGFIWIATDNGVVKYDGKDFVVYNTTHGLTDNAVFGFHQDYKDRLWFRTYNGNLSYYENDTIKPYKYNAQLKAFVNSSIISSLRYDSLDELYFSTSYGSQAAKVDSAGKISRTYGDGVDEHSVARNMDEDGRTWNFLGFIVDKIMVAASQAPRNLRFLMIQGKKYAVDLDDRETQRTWIVGSVLWKGKYYFSIHKNIFTYDGNSVEKVFSAREPLLGLYVDHEDRLWANSLNNGVAMFTDTSMKNPFTLQSVEGLSVSSVLQDYEGGIWISTLDQGVFYFPNLTIQNYKLPNNARVSAVDYGEDKIYVGNYSGEVFSMNAKGESQLVAKVTPPVSNIFLDSRKNLWISDGEGTHIHQTGVYVGGRGGNLSKTFKALFQVNDYIIGCSSIGVYKLSLAGEIIERIAARNRPISMTVAANQIYIGGLNGFEKRYVDFTGVATKLGQARTAALHALDDRYVAVGTNGHGLMIYDAERDELTSLPIADVVNVYSIISDWPQRTVWMGTDKGLFQLNFSKDSSSLTVDHFSKADGLASNKINHVCRLGGNIWAVSDLGIAAVPFGHFSTADFVPKFYINRIIFENGSMSGNVSSIKTEERDMVFDIRPITFKGHPTMFRYRLDNQPWKIFENGNIFLTHMPSENYRLEVQASSGNADWTRTLAIDIEVMAKWWDTWVFRFSMALLIIILGFLGYQLRINTIRRRQSYLEVINLHQQKLIDAEIETQERERKRIATDLHDGVGTTLSSIRMQLTGAVADEEADRKIRQKEIDDNLNDVITDIKRIVYDLHPPALERYGLRAGLKSLAEKIEKNSGVRVIFDYYGDSEVPLKVSISVYRIIQELINNTLRHAQASEIRIHTNEFEKEMNIMYEDNGIGMMGSRFTGLGLHSIESRVRSLNGRMTWESNQKGTFYNFDIPL